MNTLKTGDILLFVNKPKSVTMRFVDWMIRTTTHSQYTHVALVIKDPTFIHPLLKGLFAWESNWEGTPDPQDGKVKLGVQLTPIHEMLHDYKGHVYVRRLQQGQKLITDKKLSAIHKIVYNKPYDLHIKDWFKAWDRQDDDPQKTDRFWCSALIAYILVELGFLPKKLDWSIVRPCDFSCKKSQLEFCSECTYKEDEELL